MKALVDWLERRASVAVVGVGNPLRRDDGVGSWIADRLAALGCVSVFDAETVPENYLGAIIEAAPRAVLFVDAATGAGAPGECRLAPMDALAPRPASTHAPSLALLAELLERYGIECGLLAIQPAATTAGMGLSPEVERAAREVVSCLASRLGQETRHV
jgi:hydrogenase maturation protease